MCQTPHQLIAQTQGSISHQEYSQKEPDESLTLHRKTLLKNDLEIAIQFIKSMLK